jgi:hypothetical protein
MDFLNILMDFLNITSIFLNFRGVLQERDEGEESTCNQKQEHATKIQEHLHLWAPKNVVASHHPNVGYPAYA